VAQTQQIAMAQDQTVDFGVMPTQPPIGITAGTYRATFTASPACSQLPDDFKSRSYAATLAQDGARLDITLSGAGLNGGTPPTEVKFSGRVVDTNVTFQMMASNYYYYYYYFYSFHFGPNILLDQVTSTRFYSLYGTATGTIAGSSITGTIAGSIQSIDALNGLTKPLKVVTCTKSDHHFTFDSLKANTSRSRR
jgi:hypothetical protein